ncbi:hypothetical protein SDC9_170825 [bioreactor metagenome]|uniref:Uncharacterized protein n=1 Tax=bioreactor metagenome TaxID=1076179 RepID=A0A645G958_9ZZZZ
MVFMLGDEKKAKPSPSQTNTKTINPNGVAEVKKDMANNPTEHIAIPKVAK